MIPLVAAPGSAPVVDVPVVRGSRDGVDWAAALLTSCWQLDQWQRSLSRATVDCLVGGCCVAAARPAA